MDAFRYNALNIRETAALQLESFKYSNTLPAYVNEKVTLCGKVIDETTCSLWALNPEDSVLIKGTLKIKK